MDADDVVQNCLRAFLRRDGFGKLDAEKGRLRCYLLRCLANSRAEFYRKGQRQPVLLDDLKPGDAPVGEQADGTEPDREFDRAWWRDLVNRSLARLSTEYGAENVRVLGPLVDEGRCADGVLQTAVALGKTESATKALLNRMRRRFEMIVQEEVAATLAEPTVERVEEELRDLLRGFEQG